MSPNEWSNRMPLPILFILFILSKIRIRYRCSSDISALQEHAGDSNGR
jgi:hypothetical protein